MEDVEAYVAKLKVIELKEELKKRSLSTAGVKSVLAQRLQEALTEAQNQSEDQENTGEAEAQGGEEAPTEEEAPVEEQEATEPAEGESESTAEDEGAPTEEAAQLEQEEKQATPPEENAEEVEPLETTSQSKPEQTTEPSSDAPASTPSQSEPSAEPPTSTPSTEAQTTLSTGENVEAPTESTEGGASASMDTPTQEAHTEPETGGSANESTSEVKEPEVTPKDATEEKMEEKMDTTNAETTAEKTENGPPQEQSEIGTKRSRDRDEAPVKAEKPDPSRAPDPEEPEEFDDSQVLMESTFKPPEDESVVTLNKYTSDLHFNFREDGLGGCGLTEQGFARLWAMARASIGVHDGRYYYQVRVEENKDVELPESEEHPHAIRIGWTIDDTRKGLGEGWGSFGFGSTGKKSCNSRFETFGEPFGPGDVIGCYLDFVSSPATMSFSKNYSPLGNAFILEEALAKKTYFPCIATKNVSFSVNFGGSETWCAVEGVEGYSFIQEATEDHKVKAPLGPSSPSDCEVIMMVGLPASGKTTWAEKQCEKYPEKRYTLLGTNLIMEKMKVTGLSRKENYRDRFEVLIKEATDILNKLFLLAGKNYRNYIIDQTNVYKGAQSRKMKYFEGFFKRAQVVVPPHHELRKRTADRNMEMGGPLPDDVINAMKANFHIPKVGEIFQEVSYSDIYGFAAEKIVRQYREDALGLPSYPQSKRGRYDNYRSGGGGGGGGARYGGNRPGGYSGYPSHSYGDYGRSPYPRDHYGYGGGYGGGSYGYSHPRPRYSPYGEPPPSHSMYRPPSGGGGGGYGGGPSQYRNPYGSGGGGGGSGHYRPPPPRRGGGYYGRY